MVWCIRYFDFVFVCLVRLLWTGWLFGVVCGCGLQLFGTETCYLGVFVCVLCFGKLVIWVCNLVVFLPVWVCVFGDFGCLLFPRWVFLRWHFQHLVMFWFCLICLWVCCWLFVWVEMFASLRLEVLDLYRRFLWKFVDCSFVLAGGFSGVLLVWNFGFVLFIIVCARLFGFWDFLFFGGLWWFWCLVSELRCLGLV